MSSRKTAIRAAFEAAAAEYDAHAHVQDLAAEDLARRIRDLGTEGRALELGCGTGFLSRRLADGARPWLITDLSEAMVSRCRDGLDAPQGVEFRVMDAETPCAEGPFQLICGNLVMQWFERPERSLKRLAELLPSGGTLALSTFGRETFKEWRAAQERVGLPAVAHLLSRDAFSGLFPAGELRVEEDFHRLDYTSAADFLHEVKAIGAGTPVEGSTPLSPGQMRRALRSLDEAGPVSMTFHILTALWTKP